MSSDTTYGGPFGRAAHIYRAAGWHGVLPIGTAPNEKFPPPKGWTGHGAPYPSGADTQAWLEGPEQAYNLGLRAPAGTIGLDVDHYGAKTGGDTLAAIEAIAGPLPPTWVSSARPAPSGIRWYRVPELLDGRPINWPGEAGKFIEIIQPGHRYAVAWPSTNPEAGGARYEWRAEPGCLAGWHGEIPAVGSLTPLPDAWVRHLALSYDRTDKADLGSGQLADWWSALRPGSAACPVVHRVLTAAVDELKSESSSRHENARDAARALAALGGEGHVGVPGALQLLGECFDLAVGPERAKSGEWSRLISGAVKLAAAKNPVPLQHCQHDAATGVPAEMIPLGFSVPATTESAVAAGGPIPIVPASGLTLPEEFWAARPSLAKIRQAAHSKVRSGDVVFYGVLARLAAMAPHLLRAETGIGTAASLNLFAAIVGPSGGGKSSGLSVSRNLVRADREVEEFPLGSGEGIAEAFMGEAEEATGDMAKDGSAKMRKVRKMVRHNALFHSDEGNTLNKLIERAGSTVGETLRSSWSGETIGQKNGRVETTRTVPAGSYSAGLLIGYQPTTVLPLLADHEAGTPQRFLFCWAVDGSIPGRAARVLWPGEMPSPFPPHVPTDLPAPGTVVSVGPPGGPQITFADSITEELYDLEHAKNTGTLPPDHPHRDPFRSQHSVLRVKVAALLALLEGRRHVVDADWELAAVVLDTSDRVRIYLQELARYQAGKARAAQLAAEAEAETHRAHARSTVTAALEQTAERRVAVRVASLVREEGPATLGAVRRRIAMRDRPLVEAAVELAVMSGWLALEGGMVCPGLPLPG